MSRPPNVPPYVDLISKINDFVDFVKEDAKLNISRNNVKKHAVAVEKAYLDIVNWITNNENVVARAYTYDNPFRDMQKNFYKYYLEYMSRLAFNPAEDGEVPMPKSETNEAKPTKVASPKAAKSAPKTDNSTDTASNVTQLNKTATTAPTETAAESSATEPAEVVGHASGSATGVKPLTDGNGNAATASKPASPTETSAPTPNNGFPGTAPVSEAERNVQNAPANDPAPTNSENNNSADSAQGTAGTQTSIPTDSSDGSPATNGTSGGAA